MSALGHMLESRGLATVAIASVRVQAEKTRPPRALWTTAQLGRPFGEPGDPAHQRRVLTAALGMLERMDGPVLLEDFVEDPPGWRDNPAWRPPATRPAAPDSAAGWADAVAAEMAALRPAWLRAQARFGRTTTGLSFLPPDAWPGFAARFLDGDLPVAEGHATAALSLRFLCDDVKAYYGEAGQADGPAPSSAQLDAWFWRGTAAGAFLNRLRSAAMDSADNALRTVGGRFFVPGVWAA